jgi:tRNA pseudouridine38-40 synthase
MRIKLVVAYLGTAFSGWQRQASGRTVQAEIEEAIGRMTKGPRVAVFGAGRTDAGVHARGQVAHLDLGADIPPHILVAALNAHLPADIRILSAFPVRQGFHARFDARAKHYAYRARWRDAAPPWVTMRTARLRPVVAEAAFEEAVQLLPGTHDWASFTVEDGGPVSTTRTLFRVQFRARPDGIDLHFVGDGFLRYQVRRMVGALLEVGWRRLSPDEFRSLIDQPRRGSPVLTAPASGLTLERVYYRRPGVG